MSEPTCDWCSKLATHITHHERANSGRLTAYWCDRHYAEKAVLPIFTDTLVEDD